MAYPASCVRFNSMIVRLKGEGAKEVINNLRSEFQFYDSPIKRRQLELKESYINMKFQFYDSPIKSIYKIRHDK